jgi:small multidrug resistance pump
MPTAWLLLVSAIGIEVASTSALPRTEQFHNPAWTAAVIAGYASSIWLLALVIRHIPVSVTYAIWSGVGTAGVAVVGALFLGQRLGLVQTGALLLIIAGVVILNLSGAH